MEKMVTLNELNEIIKALDLYSRIDIGQYDEIVKVNCWFFSFIHKDSTKELLKRQDYKLFKK